MRFVRFAHGALGAFFALAATTASGRSHACGGCFHEPEPPPQPGQESKSTVVLAHRMALSVSPTQTVLWDQVQYSGAPDTFAWVLPVKPGAYLEVSNDAWFETLDAATSTSVLSPPVMCSYPNDFGDDSYYDDYDDSYYDEGSSRGCSRPMCGAEETGYGGGGAGTGAAGTGASGTGASSYGGAGGGYEPEPPPPVVVVHQATVGPYETVTLHANVPDALPQWLTDHGFVVDPNVQPIIDAYVIEGFDFIALRLVPGDLTGPAVDRMKPVRVVMPGASPTLPLRMVAAGTGPQVAITLYVISEGRYKAQNFENGEIDPDQLTWDFDTEDSNYAQLRKTLMAQAAGRTWNTSYAKQGSLFEQPKNPATLEPESFATTSGKQYSTIAETYVRQAIENQEGQTIGCIAPLLQSDQTSGKVVAACDPNGGTGGGGNGGAGTGGAASGGAASGGAASGGASAGGGGSPPAPVPPCGAGEIDGRTLACGTVDDLAVALVGLHPRDVWLTRLESNLPRAALLQDLTLGAAGLTPVSNRLVAADYLGDPCAELGGTPVSPKKQKPMRRPIGAPGKAMIAKGRTPPLAVALALTAVAVTLGRRLGRRRF